MNGTVCAVRVTPGVRQRHMSCVDSLGMQLETRILENTILRPLENLIPLILGERNQREKGTKSFVLMVNVTKKIWVYRGFYWQSTLSISPKCALFFYLDGTHE